ncbi:MAG TPA: Wzz/FepE/Etk N-terminal domain-containing protein [Aquabacterium sp.]|nr:Wzz/FepE/Etk N-terminal domain-containing protein [Aquabacterium sp.]HQC94753.1 Wzz/FepE/Etk N-terminal domain-containing protein [Aquabacterium sp.]
MAADSNPKQAVDDGAIDLAVLTGALWARRRLLTAVPILVAAAAYGLAGFLPPTFTAKASFLPQQQQQSAISSALASLGPLVGLAGQAPRNSADQFVALMQSAAITDRIIDRFDLVKLYEADYRQDARNQLLGSVRISVGKKDGLIYLEADDRDPKRAAALANAHIEELQRLVSQLAITEAQQRRRFFEAQLKQARDSLTKAQIALQGSGFSRGALRAEPKAAAEEYARLKAEVMKTEVRVQTLRGFLNDGATELTQAQAMLAALRQQLAQAESAGNGGGGGADSDYITKYREYKYQETLYELFARQYEVARVDESRDGATLQVVDTATIPEKRSGPRKARIAVAAGLAAALALAACTLIRAVGARRRVA